MTEFNGPHIQWAPVDNAFVDVYMNDMYCQTLRRWVCRYHHLFICNELYKKTDGGSKWVNGVRCVLHVCGMSRRPEPSKSSGTSNPLTVIFICNPISTGNCKPQHCRSVLPWRSRHFAYATFTDSRTPLNNVPYYDSPRDLTRQYGEAVNIRFPKVNSEARYTWIRRQNHVGVHFCLHWPTFIPTEG